MALAYGLLLQAEHLARLDLAEMADANLRRSVSASYYALFHLLVADAIERLSPTDPRRLAPRIARAFAHAEMRQICRTISQGQRSIVLDELQPEGFTPSLRLVAETFLVLQERRHAADYDLSEVHTQPVAMEIYELSVAAFAAWKTVRLTPEANVFHAALLFGGRWAK